MAFRVPAGTRATERPVQLTTMPGGGVLIGATGTELDRPLHEVLATAAADTDSIGPGWADSWSLLLRVDWSDELAANRFRDHVERFERRTKWVDLQVLFVAIAAQNPRLVCDLFPCFAKSPAIAACGQDGVRVTLHELRSGELDRRREAAFAADELVRSGTEVPRDALVSALLRERDPDVINTLRGTLRLLEANAEGAA